jgi:hypothetical protein
VLAAAAPTAAPPTTARRVVRRATPATLAGVPGRPTLASALWIDNAGPPLCDHSIEAIVPNANTAAASNILLVLIELMATSIEPERRGQFSAATGSRLDLDQWNEKSGCSGVGHRDVASAGRLVHRRKSTIVLIRFSRPSLRPFQASSLRSQALYLVPKRVHFIVKLPARGFRRIGAAQLFQYLFDGQLGYFGHGTPISKR